MEGTHTTAANPGGLPDSPWARPGHTPCPEHGRAHFDASGRCRPSCGFGWTRDPLVLAGGHADAN